jgi:aryl-alcohol dehydrogenase-like predicted oxidoreductase
MRGAYVNQRNLRIYKGILELSGELSVSVHALSLACLANQPFDVIPINSVRDVSQLEDILKAGETETDRDFIKTEGAE